MAYVGRPLSGGKQWQKLDTPTTSSNAFTMQVGGVAVTPAPEHVIIAVNGVIQEPDSGFTISGSTLTFTGTVVAQGTDKVWGMVAGDAAFAAASTINEDRLQISNAGSNGQFLSKQSGDAGGLTWATVSTFDPDDAAVFNESGGDNDFRVEGDSEQNLLFVDASTDRVGIGTASPASKLQVSGSGADIYVTNGSNTRAVLGIGGGDDGQVELWKDDNTKTVAIQADTTSYFNGGNVGIGVASPAAILDVRGTMTSSAFFLYNSGNATSAEGIKIQCGTNDSSGDTNMIQFANGAGTIVGVIQHGSGTVSYGAFTAAHEAELPDVDNDDGYDYGTLVETTEIFYTRHSNTVEAQTDLSVPNGEELERGLRYKVQKTSTAYSKSVLGSYSGKNNYKPAILWEEKDFEEGGEGIWKESDFDYGRIPENKIDTAKASVGDVRHEAENENLHQVYVLGDGHILCNSEKGDISVGDGITSSSTDGQGMKADKMCMIIGMAQEDVSFSGDESKLVAVQYGLQQFTPWE